VEPAPAPVPTGIPLVGGDGTLPDGYPVAYVDGAALRSLLWHSRYDDLDRDFAHFQDAFEADNKREYWPQDAADAFGSAEPSLQPKLDAWVAASPASFASYLARGAYWSAVGWARRGAKFATETPTDDFTAMRDAFERATADLAKALSLRPKLVAARSFRVRILSSSSGQSQAMRDEVDRATAACPGCYRIRLIYLADTTPRWGGSYDAMRAYARTCDPALNVRCKLLPGLVDDDLGDLGWTQHRLDEAEQDLDRAVALGDCSTFLVERSEIRDARREYAGALEDADRALPLWHGAQVVLARAWALDGLGRREEAGRTLLEGLRVDPTNRRGKELAPTVVSGLRYDAQEAIKAGRRDDALRLLDLAAEIAPSDSNVLRQRAWALLGSENPDIPALEAAVAKNPDDLRLHQELDYAISKETHDFARIAAMWTEYIGRHPDEARAYMERAGTYHNLGRTTESKADAKTACELGISEGCLRAN
jgi:tetratricopeptide (TPR) repeat protein